MSNTLSVSDVVNVTVSLQPTPAALRNFGEFLIAGPSAVIDVSQRIRTYTTIGGVATDFGTSAPEYYAASLFFGQNPQPALLQIGRWAQTATSGVLHGNVFGTTQQVTLLSTLEAVTAGSMIISVDGTPHTLTGLNFSGISNLNGAASIINTALTSATTVWNASYGRFDITSNSTGASSAVSYASTDSATGTDVSGTLGLTAATGASVPVAGIVAESPVACAQILMTLSNAWYGLQFVTAGTVITDSQHEAVAALIQAASPSRIYALTTQESSALDPTQTSDLCSVMKASNYSRSMGQYSSSSPYAVASILGRNATVNFTANNTVITTMFKQEPSVTAESLNETQAATLLSKNCNVFVNYNNGTAIIQPGIMFGGFFIDEIIGTDWLQNYVQTNVYNLLYTTPTKIPQTDAGIHLIAVNVAASLQQGVVNGLIAPGVWQGPSVGTIETGQVLTAGYYVYQPPISSQSYATRITRAAPALQCAITLAGAVHSASVLLSVTR